MDKKITKSNTSDGRGVFLSSSLERENNIDAIKEQINAIIKHADER